MLLFKIFGFFDALTVLAMFLLSAEIIPWRIGLIFAAYLAAKGIIFKGDFASMMDITIGFYIAVLPIFSWKFLTIIFAIYLIQKAIMSFF